MTTATAKETARLLTIPTDGWKDVLLTSGMTVSEQVSGLFTIELDLVANIANASKVKPEQLIGKPVTIKLALGRDYANGPFRHFNGIVHRFSQRGRDKRFVHYHAEVVPWLWLLTQTSDCRIFQDQTVPEIIERVFSEHQQNFSFVKFDNKTKGNYIKLDYCVQYRETDFNFVSRLMEQDGIHYFFEHDEHGHTLVLADSPTSKDVHQPCPHQSSFKYAPDGGTDESDKDVVFDWQSVQQLRPGKYALKDYHFQMPEKPLEFTKATSKSLNGNANLEIYDYLGEYAQRFNKPDQRLGDVEKEGRKFVQWRMEEEETPHLEINGAADARALVPGHTFQLTDHFDAAQNKPTWLITAVRHSITQTPRYYSDETVDDPYGNSFTCVPFDAPYRPARVTPKPVVEGLQSAVVVDQKGEMQEEIDTDKFGRVKVRFHWARTARPDGKDEQDQKCSCWLRVAQPWAGKNWGAHFWPRVGHEVLVAFMEGDPDQPIIVGSVYNNANMPPYEMPANQTRSGIKSRSSKDGKPANFNEIRFEDKKGQEEIYFHAERNFNRVVENNDSTKVGFQKGSDQHGNGNQSIEVFNNRSLTVGGGETKAAEGSETIKVFNSQNVKIGDVAAKEGNQSVEIFNNQNLKVGDPAAPDGSQTVEIWKDQKTTLKTGNRDVKIEMGNDSLEVLMGNQTTKINLGKSTTQAMQSIELIVGANSIKVDQSGITLKGLTIKIEGTIMAEMTAPLTTVQAVGVTTIKGGVVLVN